MVTKPCAGRLGDILRPLRQVLNAVSNNEDWFMNFVTGTEAQRKQLGAESLEAQAMNAIVQARELVEKGHLLNEHVLRYLNDDKSERERITHQKLGKILARLGFEKYSSGQQRGFYWNENLVARLCQRYGIDSGTVAF